MNDSVRDQIPPWRLGVSEWTLRESSTSRALDLVVRAGFDAVELAVAARTDTARSRRAVVATGLTASSVCVLFGSGADLSSADPDSRRTAVELLQRSVECAGEVGAGVVIVTPSDSPRPPTGPRHDHLDRAAESIASVAQGIPAGGPVVVVEPLNRYETHLVRTLDQAADLARLTGDPSVGVMGDLFHMNIEEASLWEPLHRNADLLKHLHLAENHRQAPGTGSIGFHRLFDELSSMGYQGALVIECLPATLESLTRSREHLTGLMLLTGAA